MPHSTPIIGGREGTSIETPRPRHEVYGNARASRQASISSAIGSIQKFKESWMSIMFLKAGVGLGQVIVLIVMLVLATTLDSPLFPGRKQTEASDACPRPVLFQSWMIVQIFRLTICWSISCWVALRAHFRVDHESERDLQGEEIQIENLTATPHVPIPTPPMSHSTSSSSNTTLADVTHSPETNLSPSDSCTLPGSSYFLPMHTPSTSTSTASVDMMGLSTPKQRLRLEPAFSPHTPVPVVHAIPSSRRNSTLALARATHLGQVSESTGRRSAGFAVKFEKMAPKLTKMLGGISFVLFVLGNVLLFNPLPAEQNTCYHASPMLWWGVMTVTGVGWFLFGQILVVVLVIGVGGPAILAVLRRLPCLPTPPEPVPARPPQPAPLTLGQLAKLPVVCYIPHTQSAETTEKDIMADKQSVPVEGKIWDQSRLPYPAHPLQEDQATCAICQENYTEPESVRRVLYQADPLRLLGCGHVYHVDCIDKWLTEKSGICPYCNQGVIAAKQVDSASETRWWRRRPPPDSLN